MKTVQEINAARAQIGMEPIKTDAAVFVTSGDNWFYRDDIASVPWANGIANHQRDRRNLDVETVKGLAVGQSATVVTGFHRKHGERTTTITRIA